MGKNFLKLENSKILSIKKIKCSHKIFYDLEVEDNNNFFAGSCLVHNSATPYRSDGNDMKMFAALGNIVYQTNINDLTEQGYLCDAEIRIMNLYEHPKVMDWDLYPDVYLAGIVNNEERNRKAAEKAKEHGSVGTSLVLVDRVEHGQKLLDEIDWGKYKVLFVHGSTKERKKIFDDINKGMYDIIIATKIYGEGVNIPRLDTLILAGGGKSAVAVVQKIGRILRLFENKEKAVIYDFADEVKYLRQHYRERLKIYRKNKFKVYLWNNQTILQKYNEVS